MAEKNGTRKTKPKSSAASKKHLSPEEKDRIDVKTQINREALLRKREIHDEIIGIVLIALGIFLIVSLQTESTGMAGAFFRSLLFGHFGKIAYGIPYFLIVYSILIFAKKTAYVSIRSGISIVLLILLASTFGASFEPAAEKLDFAVLKEIFTLGKESGGVFGMMFSKWLVDLIGRVGLNIVCFAGVIIMALFIINTPLSVLFDNLKLKSEAAAKAFEERRLELEVENEKKEAEKRLKAEMAAREAARQEKNAPQKETEKNTKAEKSAESTESVEPEAFVPAKETLADEPEIARLDTQAMRSFDADIRAVSKETRAVPAAVSDYVPPAEEKSSAEETAGDKTSEYDDKQKNIIGYVTKDDRYGLLNQTPACYGLTGSTDVQQGKNTAEKKKPAADEASEPVPVSAAAVSAAAVPAAGQGETKAKKPYAFPPMDLLKKPAGMKNQSTIDLKETSELLERTMSSFGVSAKVVDAVRGPAVTRFEVQPDTGVKVQKITQLRDDIALNLKAKSLRIEAPIPGKAAVGIEVSNNIRKTVALREILDSDVFRKAKSRISVGLGHTISGESVVANLKDMPHLLIAGSTGSGKSVCINSIIMSILYKATPEEVKLIMIDPKVVELSNYNGIPHLYLDVVTEPAKASAALGWAVSEMNERYNKFAEAGVRDLESYNDICRVEGEPGKVLPQFVIIIDELADLIMAAKNQVEDNICRLAQKARAAGMYLIIATQRPSADIITGVIKANVPSRIAFAVSSSIDSRVILDSAGAENLLGKGDMLYHPTGMSKPIRVQGCFVSDEEVNNVIAFVKEHNDPAEVDREALAVINSSGAAMGSSNAGEEEDELLTDAVSCVVEIGRASVSALQRRYRIGYNRAARLVELMEERGIVAPSDGTNNPRKVLISKEQFLSTHAEYQEKEDFLSEHPEFKEDIV